MMSTIFFVAGGLFAHYIAFPVTWAFFGSFGTDYMMFVPKVDEAFALYIEDDPRRSASSSRCRRWCSSSRGWASSPGSCCSRYFKYAFLAIFIIAAVISPGTDMASQLVMAVPMMVLYLLSIGDRLRLPERRKPATDSD